MKKKYAIVLFNLGGPSILNKTENFLFNLFYDPAIIRLPNPFRWMIAKIIAKKRTPIAKEIYKKIGHSSPILINTNAQAIKLQEKLYKIDPRHEYKTFSCMRYSSPRAKEVVEQIKNYKPSEIIAIPLYPQFSVTTSESSIKEFYELIKNQNIIFKTLCCFFTDESFIKSHTSLIENYINNADNKKKIILFSAHGLPEIVIKDGDPYQWQVEQTVKLIMERIKDKNIENKICYQSKVGPMKWVGPSTESLIAQYSQQGYIIIIVPISFVSEHSETLVELDIEYKKIAEKKGCSDYIRIPTLSLNDNFIESLVNSFLVLKRQKINNKQDIVFSNKIGRICPREFCGCINQLHQ